MERMLISFHINLKAEFSTWKNPGHQDISSSDFPSGPVVKNLLASAGDTGSIPGPGRFHMLQGNEFPTGNYIACALGPMSHN